MKKLMIISIFVIALSNNVSAECGDIHTHRCLVDHHQPESKTIQQDTKDQDEISITSILDYFKVQIIRIIQ